MTLDARELAIRYRANIESRRALHRELAPLLDAARPIGWSELERLTHLSRGTLRRLASLAPSLASTSSESPPPPLPLNLATLLRLTRSGRRLARLIAEQREQREVLGEVVRAMRARECGWRTINNTLGGRMQEDVAWLRALAREPGPAGRPRRRPAPTSDHLQAMALGRDRATLALIRLPHPTPATAALLARRLQRYDRLAPERIARIAGVHPPPPEGGDTS